MPRLEQEEVRTARGRDARRGDEVDGVSDANEGRRAAPQVKMLRGQNHAMIVEVDGVQAPVEVLSLEHWDAQSPPCVRALTVAANRKIQLRSPLAFVWLPHAHTRWWRKAVSRIGPTCVVRGGASALTAAACKWLASDP